MVLLLALLLVLLLFGAGFAVHLLWIAAVVFAIVWIVGFAIGRGESAGCGLVCDQLSRQIPGCLIISAALEFERRHRRD